MEANKDLETFGGGCFWCLEAVFEQLLGVERVSSGYAGGDLPNPSYQQVCSGWTGHAEVVQITFNPEVISYRELLEVFFQFHDPTVLDRQGPDVGTQYRSAVYFHNLEQRSALEEIIKKLDDAGVYGRPIVTEIAPFTAFYMAEEYHRQYYRRNLFQPYCQINIVPKIAKLKEVYSAKLRVL